MFSSIHFISSDEDEPMSIQSGDITSIPETQMDVDNFQLVVNHRQKRRFKLELLRQEMEQITKDLCDQDSASDTSGNYFLLLFPTFYLYNEQIINFMQLVNCTLYILKYVLYYCR